MRCLFVLIVVVSLVKPLGAEQIYIEVDSGDAKPVLADCMLYFGGGMGDIYPDDALIYYMPVGYGVSDFQEAINTGAIGSVVLFEALGDDEGMILNISQIEPVPVGGGVTTGDTGSSEQWYCKDTFAGIWSAWEKYGYGNPDVVVVVMDSGIDINNPDLQPRGLSTIEGASFLGNDPWDEDTAGHGTGIAGAIWAEHGNQYGLAGIAPDVDMVIWKVSYPCGSYTCQDNNAVLDAQSSASACDGKARKKYYSKHELVYYC